MVAVKVFLISIEHGSEASERHNIGLAQSVPHIWMICAKQLGSKDWLQRFCLRVKYIVGHLFRIHRRKRIQS